MNNLLDFEGNDDDDIEVFDIIELGIPRRVIERQNYFDSLDAVTFRKRFRLTKECILFILPQIEARLEFPTDINNSVSPVNQLLTCLRLFSTGGHLDAIGDYMGMHESTVSRIAKRVSEVLASQYNEFIKMPSNRDECRLVQQGFYNLAQFPRVVGALDCTHVKIQSPGGDDAEVFRNRKSYFSINAQMVCDSNLRIMDVVARWPGSAHDSTIFNHSQLRRRFDNGHFQNTLLLGDSGYPSKRYLFTPLLQPITPSDHQYNRRHITTRNTIERCFGVLKRRFPILAYGCRLKIETVQTVIVAAAILHNIAQHMGDIEPPPIPDELDEHEMNVLIENGQIPNVAPPNEYNAAEGNLTRRQFIDNYFNRF